MSSYVFGKIVATVIVGGFYFFGLLLFQPWFGLGLLPVVIMLLGLQLLPKLIRSSLTTEGEVPLLVAKVASVSDARAFLKTLTNVSELEIALRKSAWLCKPRSLKVRVTQTFLLQNPMAPYKDARRRLHDQWRRLTCWEREAQAKTNKYTYATVPLTDLINDAALPGGLPVHLLPVFASNGDAYVLGRAKGSDWTFEETLEQLRDKPTRFAGRRQRAVLPVEKLLVNQALLARVIVEDMQALNKKSILTDS